MTRHEEIRESYKTLGSIGGVYDGIVTRSTPLGKLMDSLIWGLDASLAAKWLDDALAPISTDFAGSLLEVPVGTGVLTMPVYRKLPNAEITCLDYSPDMMASAQAKAKRLGIANATFMQGDVGALPFPDEHFDVVLSLNGFHAFPDKEAAYAETFRVLKKGGTFCGCFYIRGVCKRTDWFVHHLYVPRGFFTPPFETLDSLRSRLKGLYVKVEAEHVEGIACFRCVK